MRKIILIFCFVFLFAGKAFSFSVNHEFDVFIGKFNASRTDFSYSLTDKNFSVYANVKTYGLFNTLYPFSAEYSSEGKVLKNGNMQTVSSGYDAKSRFNKRTKKLVYNDKGLPIYRISSKNDKEKTVDIEQQANTEGTTDLQTAIAELVKQYKEMKFCDSRMEIFDGKKRFDVVFKDEGKENIKANKYSKIEGMASKCSMFIDNFGTKGDDLLWEMTSDRPVYFWIMEKDGKPFVAKIEVKETDYGKISVYTRKVEVKE